VEESIRVIKASFWHCISAVASSGLFSGAIYCIRLFFPIRSVQGYLDQVEFALVILLTLVLGALFVNTLGRIVRDSFVTTWKKVSNGSTQLILA
jgi:hypothetical protein